MSDALTPIGPDVAREILASARKRWDEWAATGPACSGTSLRATLEKTARERWDRTKSFSQTRTQARKAVEALEAAGIFTVEAASAAGPLMATIALSWAATEGHSAATIRVRLKCLRAIGVAVPGGRGPAKTRVSRVIPPAMREALEITAGDRWDSGRNSKTQRIAAEIALSALAEMGLTDLSQVRPNHLRTMRDAWLKEGKSVSTVAKRLMCLSAMGVKISGCVPKQRPVLKWWLNPTDQQRLVAWLRTSNRAVRHEMADHIEWTCFTGLRIEETQRLKWRDVEIAWKDGEIDIARMSMTVPGLKTFFASATLPLGREAAEIILRRWYNFAMRHKQQPAPEQRVFPMSYESAVMAWRDCRMFLGIEANSMATLKALRRSAARYLHMDKGMPLDVVRQYLRHSDIQTTLGYLRLTGGYGTEEMRKWL